jgi:hypothetical protein
MENSPEKSMRFLITFRGASICGDLLRVWEDCTSILVAFEGALGPYSNFMPLVWDQDEGAYRDLVYRNEVDVISLLRLPPDHLNGISVWVHRQLSPEPGRRRKGEAQLS